ncbi:hypothetical protein [Eubacterium sp. 1001713B170207_170306_E7]|uniref:hypothetical protein n=1 Tax=Eubacterium sp. 1001713B170207_170306_E7 TaxID=2787097 RepID=UPI00189BF45F|nr:hypothetical protein [Eubacterium sp. 1001713B170207_170306_E7]
MKHFYLLINDQNIQNWTLVNQVSIIKAGKTNWYFPDILYRHPFDEGSLCLTINDSLSAELASALETAFKKLPPHRIVLLRINSNPEWQKAFSHWKATLESNNHPFFTPEESLMMEKTKAALRLTESQKIVFTKACISQKLRSENRLLNSLLPYTELKVAAKKERSAVFNALLKTLWA